MKNDFRHIVHPSLIRQAKIAGVSSSFFGMELLFALLMFNFFRMSLITPILIGIIFFVIHPMIRKAQKDDPLAIQLWIVSAISGQSYYPAKSNIGRTPPQGKSSIPKHK